ncbi:MAG: hypothetical protein JNL28_04335 [Planctomycetes bacterium]|nr:hypothetical protein [Planctomycetota bacterium]
MSLLRCVTILVLSTGTFAQTNFPEIEPNSTKSQATLVAGMVGNDTITGLSTGTTATSGLTTDVTVDVFRVRTGALPFGIYRHTLALTSPVAGHSGTLRGLVQSIGVISSTDTAFQTSVTTTTPARSNTWYAFGRQEEIYYRVQGVAATTASYTATLTTTPVAPLAILGAFAPGSITITTTAQGHTTDTEIYLYDGNLDPVPLGHNDDLIGGIASLSTVTRTLAAGTYYVAVSNYNTANNQSDLNPNEAWDDGPVLDFPNAMANSSTTGVLNVTFAVSDGTTTTSTPATKLAAFDIVWGRFTVGNPSTVGVPFCFGDGLGTACPCANSGAAGRGCANSTFPAGTVLTSSGVAGASPGTDTLVLTASDIPGPGLFFQGSGTFSGGAGITFGDGLLCAGGTITRMGVVFPAGNTASVPGPANPTPLHIKGATSNGDVRHYQCWYRDALVFCTASTFNLTQALTLTWGP